MEFRRLHVADGWELDFTLKDLKEIEGSAFNKDAKRNASILVDLYYEDESGKDAVESYLALLKEALRHAVSRLPGAGHTYNLGQLRLSLLETQQFVEKPQDLFPVPIYVSADGGKDGGIGVLVHWESGKPLELFEGNEEASERTVVLVNKLLGLGQKEVTVWGSHHENTVQKIKQSGILPKGLYVSPDRHYAEGYWGKDRVLFSGKITLGEVNQESEKDWRILQNIHIKDVRIWN